MFIMGVITGAVIMGVSIAATAYTVLYKTWRNN